MVRQNKWRAARFGLDARLIDAQDYSVQSVEEIVGGLVDRLKGIACDLGCESELLFVKEMARSDGWAERQRQILESTNDRREIVRRLSGQSRLSGLGAEIK